jgi:hypothetical protein
MDPATIRLLITIVPTVLDLLFGQGHHIKKSLSNQNYPDNMYGYGLEGYGMLGEGYRYPRRRRKSTVQTYYPEAVHPELIRATVFNRAVAKENPWIVHLRATGAYDRIREELQKAATTYKTKDPEKRAKSLAQQLTKLQAQMNILENEAKTRSLAPEFSRKYPRIRYEDMLMEKMRQLQDEIKSIQRSLPTP